MSRVGGWDGDAVGGVEDVLDAVQTFGGELVVAERAEQFGDEDVDVTVAWFWIWWRVEL